MVLSIGHKVPPFSLPDTEGRNRKLDEFVDAGPAVIAFFPFAFSGTCDKEMCVFRDGFGALRIQGARLVGISVDSVFTLKAFASTYNLDFPLLSDFNKKVSKSYGVLQERWVDLGYRGVSKRAIMVVDSRSILRYRWLTDDPGEEPPYPDVYKAARKPAA